MLLLFVDPAALIQPSSLFSCRLPWVFTFNSWSEKYDYMVKVAVRSAVEVGGVRPYCMFSGKETSAIYKFLVKSGVKVSKSIPGVPSS